MSKVERIIPHKLTSTITISVDQYPILKEKLSKKLWNHYIYKKSVHGERVVFEIKSNVVNKFCQLLNHLEIDWNFHRFHNFYK